MSPRDKLEAIARIWLGEPPWDLTAEKAVVAVHQLGKELRGLYDPRDPDNTGVGIQRQVLAMASEWARMCVESMGLLQLVAEGDQRAAELFTAIELEARARLIRALDGADVTRAFADDNLSGYLETAAEMALASDIAATASVMATEAAP